MNCLVFADEKEYSYDSVDFLVQLNADGSADVKETWVVNYEKGSFSRFYKNIYLNVPKDEKFTIDNWSILVDSIPCEYTENTEDRPDFHYGLVDKGGTISYEVYAKSEKQIRIYEINYTLYDVVKYVDGQYYLFTYRFLPDGYKNNVRSFNISILTPGDCEIDSLYQTKGSVETFIESGKDGLRLKASNVSDMFKLRVKINGAVFGSLPTSSYLKDSDLSNNTDKVEKGWLTINGYNFGGSFVFSFFIFLAFLSLMYTLFMKSEKHYGKIALAFLIITFFFVDFWVIFAVIILFAICYVIRVAI